MKNIFLDLDNTLISSEYISDIRPADILRAKHFDCKVFDDEYLICARPYLQNFLDFLFKNFKVSIWTAASKDYALFIINEFILKKNHSRKLNLILYDYHTNVSRRTFKTPKKLEILWSKWNLKEYNNKNTIIIDDLEEVCDSQRENCILVKVFEFTHKNSENDDSLRKVKQVLADWV